MLRVRSGLVGFWPGLGSGLAWFGLVLCFGLAWFGFRVGRVLGRLGWHGWVRGWLCGFWNGLVLNPDLNKLVFQTWCVGISLGAGWGWPGLGSGVQLGPKKEKLPQSPFYLGKLPQNGPKTTPKKGKNNSPKCTLRIQASTSS